MATRSAIAKQLGQNKYKAIYCHWDGYPEGVGACLFRDYNTPERVDALLKLGDLSSLHSKLEPTKGSGHSFDTPEKDVTIAYGRDRREKNVEAQILNSIDEIKKRYDCDYIYIFTLDNEWKFIYADDSSNELVDLKQFLEKKATIKEDLKDFKTLGLDALDPDAPELSDDAVTELINAIVSGQVDVYEVLAAFEYLPNWQKDVVVSRLFDAAKEAMTQTKRWDKKNNLLTARANQLTDQIKKEIEADKKLNNENLKEKGGSDTTHMTHNAKANDTIKESRILKECRELDCKAIYDADGFTTEYTLYYDPKNDEYFTIFGDKDLYDGNPDEADMTFATEEEAREWFDNYEGFIEDSDLRHINEATSGDRIIGDDLEAAIRSLLQEKIDEDIVTIHTTMYKDATWSLRLVDAGLYKIKYELDIDFANYPIKKDPSFKNNKISTLIQWDLEDIADVFDTALRESELGVCLIKRTLDKYVYGDVGVNNYLGEASIEFVVGRGVEANKKVETSTESVDQSTQVNEAEGDSKDSFNQKKPIKEDIYEEKETCIKKFQNITFPKDKDTNLKNWYKAEFPTDELGDKIPSSTTFKTIFDLLQKHKDVYPYLAGDSIVRERVFDGLCNILECDYDDIYYTWLETGKPASSKQNNNNTLGNTSKDQKIKMDLWHDGKRNENVAACSDDKIKEFLTICKEKGYDKEANILRAELEKRGALEESLLEDGEGLDTTDIEDTLLTIIKRVFNRKHSLYVYNLDIDKVAEKNDQLEFTLLNSIKWDDEGGLEDDYRTRIMVELGDDLSDIEENIRLSSLNETFDVENVSHKTSIDITSKLEDFADDKYTYNAEVTVILTLPLRDDVKFLY